MTTNTISEHMDYVHETLKLHPKAQLDDELYFPGIHSENVKESKKATSKYNKAVADPLCDPLMDMVLDLNRREYTIGLKFVINDVGVENITQVLAKYAAKYLHLKSFLDNVKQNKVLHTHYFSTLSLKKNDFVGMLLNDLFATSVSFDKKDVVTRYKLEFDKQVLLLKDK